MQAKIKFDIDTKDFLVQVSEQIDRGINRAFRNFGESEAGDAGDAGKKIIRGLIYGDKGYQDPFIKSRTWQYITSPRGRGELGFVTGKEPFDLLKALYDGTRIYFSKKGAGGKLVTAAGGSLAIGAQLTFLFFDRTHIRVLTKHPAAGRGKMKPGFSWFDWIDAGKMIKEPAGFVKSPIKGIGAPRSAAIAGGDAGYMRAMSGKSWQVAPQNRLDLELLVLRNRNKMLISIIREISDQIKNELRLGSSTVPF